MISLLELLDCSILLSNFPIFTTVTKKSSRCVLNSLANLDFSYNVLFLLTSSRNFNYEGLGAWLQKAENSRIVNKIEFAIFLDSLAERDNLNLQLVNVDQSNNEAINNVLKVLGYLNYLIF